MDVYVCGNSPLVQPPPCPRYYPDRPNECSHVASGQVDPSGTHRACPLMAMAPKLVLSGLKEVSIEAMGAENVLRIEDENGTRLMHCRDGHDRTIEEASIIEIRKRIKDGDIQDIWVEPEYKVYEDDDGSDVADDLFGGDSPRDPVVHLGLLTRDGRVYRVNQVPFSMTETTSTPDRTQFAHAMFRQECNSAPFSTWPAVVLQRDLSTIHVAQTMDALRGWLRGEQSAISTRLSSPVTKLLTSRGRAEFCAALTEHGKVYRWTRDQRPENQESRHDSDGFVDAGYMDVPPTKCVALGQTLGASLTDDGRLYVFSLLQSTTRDIHTPHIADLDDSTSQHRMPQRFEPRLASINAEGLRFVDVAAGDEHLVALTADGRVYTVGSGFQGALGIGDKQFQLDNNDTRSFEWSHEATQFSEDWQEVDIVASVAGARGEGNRLKVVKVAAGHQSTILITSAVH